MHSVKNPEMEFKILKITLFIYFWLWWVFIAVRAFL